MAEGQLFKSGQVVVTPGAMNLRVQGISLFTYLKRHLTGDWGDLSERDKEENQFSLHRNLRLLSSYNTPLGKLWIITEADRSSTTILLPDEY